MTVVLGPGWPGVLLHEAIGHGLEGDFNRKRVSAFTGRVGTRVASELCTVIDDGTLARRRGSLNVDDEGTPTQRTVLIERGILRGYLQDRLNAALRGLPPTGNGRRESFAHLPMPRMTNTFMLAGEDAPEDIIRSVDRGLYAVYFGGGQVDITSGKFVFSASEAYLIEGGKVTQPVRGATLIGNGPDVLTRITRVGADLRLDEGIGTCGKDGQSVPVGVGLPTVRIDGLTVGGTQAGAGPTGARAGARTCASWRTTWRRWRTRPLPTRTRAFRTPRSLPASSRTWTSTIPRSSDSSPSRRSPGPVTPRPPRSPPRPRSPTPRAPSSAPTPGWSRTRRAWASSAPTPVPPRASPSCRWPPATAPCSATRGTRRTASSLAWSRPRRSGARPRAARSAASAGAARPPASARWSSTPRPRRACSATRREPSPARRSTGGSPFLSARPAGQGPPA